MHLTTITCKKERGQHVAILTEQASLIKDLPGLREKKFQVGRVVRSGQDTAILPARVGSHSAGFG